MKKICAVVVTYNRLNLLIECIEQLENQTLKLDNIIVVDNASTDNTAQIIRKQFPTVEVVELEENVGGAGGFHEGIKAAYEQDYEWIWILDDDTIPNDNALEELSNAYNKFPEETKPVLLASKVVWSDGTLHPMNIPSFNLQKYENLYNAATQNCLSLRSASFVSILVNKEMVKKYGLPLKEYFIWNDDVEFTSRILRNEFGILTPKSIVVHKTNSKYTPLESSGGRYFYEIRNKLWLLRTKSFNKKEKIHITYSVSIGLMKYLKINKLKISSILTVFKGLYCGIFKYN